MKDFLFVDAVSGTPLGREEAGGAPRPDRTVRRSKLGVILIALIAAIVVLVSWAFS